MSPLCVVQRRIPLYLCVQDGTDEIEVLDLEDDVLNLSDPVSSATDPALTPPEAIASMTKSVPMGLVGFQVRSSLGHVLSNWVCIGSSIQ